MPAGSMPLSDPDGDRPAGIDPLPSRLARHGVRRAAEGRNAGRRDGGRTRRERAARVEWGDRGARARGRKGLRGWEAADGARACRGDRQPRRGIDRSRGAADARFRSEQHRWRRLHDDRGDAATRETARRGGLLGAPKTPLAVPPAWLMRGDIVLRGSLWFEPDDVAAILELVAAGVMDLSALQAEEYPLRGSARYSMPPTAATICSATSPSFAVD